MMKINVNVFPSGSKGYNFKEGDGTVLTGNSWAGVVKQVRRYRALNGIPMGNPEDEVHAQACARNPAICKESVAVAAPSRPATLKGRVLSWLSLMRKLSERGPLAYVQAAEMKARADVCTLCPFNKALPEGCSTCKLAVAELRKVVLGERRLNERDQRITACDMLGCDLPTAAWLDEPRIKNDGLPAKCWRKAGV